MAQIQDEAGHFRGASELVVEVLSTGKTNEDRDRLAKLKLYSVQGVQEYWIVDRIAQRVEIYRRHKAKLTLVTTLLVDDGSQTGTETRTEGAYRRSESDAWAEVVGRASRKRGFVKPEHM